MNAYLNYLIEANIGLLLFLAFYKLLLKKETNFAMLRMFLLAGVLASLLFPLVHIENDQNPSPLSIGNVIPSYWLPEVVIDGEVTTETHEGPFTFWRYATQLYWAGFIGCLMMVSFQLMQLFRIIRSSETYTLRTLRIAESTEDKPTFSFFNFIFIGNASALATQEKQQIIQHESVHAKQWHSADILLINVLKIFFWFNPFVNTYKKIFIHLHEFEADARAVENSDVNKYCSLLARVALQSANLKLANHFNNSLTVKRIEMMRTIKTNIKQWKLVALAFVLPSLFLFIACQDQIGDDLSEITQNSSHALIIPAHIQSRYEQLKKENPDKQFAVLELNETASRKLQDLEAQYGLPKSIEVFKTVNGKSVEPPVRGESASGVILEKQRTQNEGATSGDGKIMVGRTEPKVDGEQTFAILEFNEEASRIADASQQDEVFTVVEHQPEYPGGYDSLISFIRQNLRYPSQARQQGIEGTVYVSFIVEKDGAISSVNPIRGISPDCDEEVKRVVSIFPKWIPGKQNGQAVRVRFVLPVKFNL